ncbi:uncharacterized protein N7446_007886 [Penicillium canescens]|uniref:Uncharacterized protein n=1 Tax=Penicillium canescens TaxID=5083 RepID=A0AAD6IN47_PENCN|nr:uncharacterized protein N7446_007886 [Penicillium canescens]KAJ6033822.1 hypothetical protein N7444_011593 [Penicillium canescens]KAJ6056987.1 hypothetical protein N7460_000261 [Penicillium canescens]KAJ6058303.1 hypothetical protein N7446_007886 [Penicillium canescens]
MTSLRTEDVTTVAEDNEGLKRLYKELTGYKEAVIEENGKWLSTNDNKILVRGPYDFTTAIVINLSGGEGSVSFFRGNDHLQSFPTSSNPTIRSKMVILDIGCYCWSMREALVKVIMKQE